MEAKANDALSPVGPVSVKPPDRHDQYIEANTNKAAITQGSAVKEKMPKKNIRSATHVNQEMLAHLESLYANPRKISSSLNSRPAPRMSTFDPTPIVLRAIRDRQQPQQSDVIQKRNKSEMDAIYNLIRNNHFLQPVSPGKDTVSDRGYGSTRSSEYLLPTVPSDPNMVYFGINGEIDEWSMRWSIDKVGKAPGQLRGPRGVCVSRNSGNVIVADSKNARLQVFSGSSGKLISVLGADSLDQRIATTFYDVSQRKMEPGGLCETSDGSLLVVTDLNRVLYVEAETKHGGLQGVLTVPDRTHLAGVAITQSHKLILSEDDSTKPSVGLYENNGTLIRLFKGDFRCPSYIAWNEELEIAAVSDGEQQCVLLYDANGKLLNKLGHQVLPAGTTSQSPPGTVSKALVYPAGVCWMDAYHLLVADRSEHRVVSIDIRNASIEDVLTDSVGGLKHPVAMATNRRNRIVLTEEFYDFGVNEARLKMFRLMTSSNF